MGEKKTSRGEDRGKKAGNLQKGKRGRLRTEKERGERRGRGRTKHWRIKRREKKRPRFQERM